MKINRRQLRRLINEVVQEGLTVQHSYKDPHDPDVAYTHYNQREAGRVEISQDALNDFLEYAEMHELERDLHFKVEEYSSPGMQDTIEVVFMDADAAREANEYHFGGAVEIDQLSSRASNVIKKMKSRPF